MTKFQVNPFFNGDYEPQDYGFVSINNGGGAKIATLWMESSGSDPGDPNNVAYLSATDWTHWNWQAPESGAYELVLGISTSGDNAFESYAYFDNITVASVPEPSTYILLFMSFFLDSNAKQAFI